MSTQISWAEVQSKYDQLLGKIPVFMRPIALQKVTKKAETLVLADNRQSVTEKDLVDAFFAETPFGFHGPLKNDMHEFGTNYQQYGYEK